MTKKIREEGHYTLKRVDKLPKYGSANFLYAIINKENTITEVWRWKIDSKTYEKLSIGGNFSEVNNNFIGNQIVVGSYVHLGGLQYYFWADLYYINGVRYSDPINATITLSDADPTNNRIDLPVITAPGTIEIIEGSASINPSEPDIDEENQVSYPLIIVEAGTTAPTGITNEVVYNENVGEPTEWVATSNSAAIDVGSTDDAQNGSVSIRYNNSAFRRRVEFTNDSLINGQAVSNLIFRIKLLESPSNHRLFVRFYNTAGPDGIGVTINNGQFGYDTSNIGGWQTIVIPATVLGISTIFFNRIRIANWRAGTSDFFIDNIILQSGVSLPISDPSYTLELDGDELSLFRDGVSVSTVDLSGLGGGTPNLQAVTDVGNRTTNNIDIGTGTNTLTGNRMLTIGQDIDAAYNNSLYISGEVNGAITDGTTNPYHGGNLIVSDVYFSKTTTLRNNVYGSISTGFGNTIGGTDVGIGASDNVVYASGIMGIDNVLYGAKAGFLIGTGLISGASRCLVVGSHNVDLAQVKATSVHQTSFNYNPRFIVGTSPDYNENDLTGTPTNGFVVMSDGHVSAPSMTIGMIDTPTIPQFASGTTDGTNTNELIDSTAFFTETAMQVGDVVRNTTDTTSATIVSIDSDTTLTLSGDIFVSGEDYVVEYANFADRTLPTKEWILAQGFGGASSITNRTIYVNTTKGVSGVVTPTDGYIYSSLNDAVDSLFAENHHGNGWLIEITDSEAYELTSDLYGDVASSTTEGVTSRFLRVYSKYSPVVTQKFPIRIYQGVFDIVFDGGNPNYDNGTSAKHLPQWNFEFNTNLLSRNYMIDMYISSYIRFKGLVSTVNDGVGQSGYTPYNVFNLERTAVFEFDVKSMTLNSVARPFGGNVSYSDVNKEISVLRIRHLIDNSEGIDEIDQLRSSDTNGIKQKVSIRIDHFTNGSSTTKILSSGSGIPDDSAINYTIGRVDSPNASVRTGYANSTNTERYSTFTYLGGYMENFYFHTTNSYSNKRYIHIGANGMSKIQLDYTLATTQSPISCGARYDLISEPDFTFDTELHNLDISITGGVNVGHSIVNIPAGANNTRCARALFNNVNITIEDAIDANIFNIGWKDTYTIFYPPLTVVGGYYKVNAGKYVFNVVPTGDATGREIIRIPGNAVNYYGGGNLLNGLNVELIDSDPMKDIHLGEVELRNYKDIRPDDGSPLNMLWTDSNGNLKKSAIPSGISIGVKDEGVSIETALSQLDFIGAGVVARSVGSGLVQIEINGSLYETVTAIPSYLQPDSAKASGSVELTGGGSGSVDGITVDGVELMNGIENFDTDLDTTATNVADNINANNSLPNYTAVAVGSVVNIYSAVFNSSPNGFVVVSSTTTITATDTNMSGGVTVPAGLPTVIDNKDSTYDILIVDKSADLPISLFGAKADLEYQDIGITGSSTTVTWTGFDQSYVGKEIRIKNSYQNPDTAGSEINGTTLGRLVTLSATIQSVTDGVSAELDIAPTETNGSARAYIYTNQCENIYRAMRFCYYRNIQGISFNSSGTYGVDFNNKGVYSYITNPSFELVNSAGSLELKSTHSNTFIKCTMEDRRDSLSFFKNESGNYNGGLTFNIPILPADRFGQNPMLNNKIILEVLSGVNSTSEYNILNQKWSENNVDGNDAFWNKVVSSDSVGGQYANGKRSSMIFNIEKSDVRCKNGGYSAFQNDGYSKELHFNDVKLFDEQHFTGENGRAFATDNQDSTMQWEYNTGNFSVTSNVVTTTDLDFSWYDHSEGAIQIEITINGQTAGLASITDAKTAVLSSGISDVSGQNCRVNLVNRTYFDHIMYIHPSMICTMERVVSNNCPGRIKMYSDSGIVDSTLGYWKINNCDLYQIETLDGGTTSTATVTEISNSKVRFAGMSGYVYTKNSYVSGTFTGHEYKDEGGNIYDDNAFNTLFTINDDNLVHRYLNTTGSLRMRYIGTGVYVEVDNPKIIDNAHLPTVVNGTLSIKNFHIPDGVTIAAFTAGYLSANTVLEFENFKWEWYDNNYQFLRNNDWSAFQIGKWRNTTYTKNNKDSNILNFDDTGVNVGKVEINKDNAKSYYPKAKYPAFNEWWAYKEIKALFANLTYTSKYIIDDHQFNLFFGSWLPTFGITRQTPNTGTSGEIATVIDSQLPLLTGEFTLEFVGDTNIMNPYHHSNGAGTFNSSLRENSTLSNMVLKSLERINGEIVRFKADPIDGRIIELGSNIDKKYTSTTPTRLGVVGEELFLDDGSGVYWEYEIDFVDDSTNSYAGTQTDVDEKDDTNTTTQTNTHIDITGNPEWSIGQEKTDGSKLIDFDFTLNINGGGTLEFEYADTLFINATDRAMDAHYHKWLWHFKSSDAAGYECFINNRTGQIVFNGTITETLDAANIITVNSGDKITRREWVEKPNGIPRTVKVALSASEVKNIGTTPIEAIAAPGTGKAIKVLSSFANLTWGSVAFDNNDLALSTNTGGVDQFTLSSFIDSIADNTKSMTASDADNNIVVNDAINITGTDSVAAGDSTVDIYITYSIITL